MKKPVHVPASGINEPGPGYVRCLPSGAIHPTTYDCEQKEKGPAGTGPNQEER